MKINSLTLIPMMFCGILLFSSLTCAQDRSGQTQITRSDYISMDKQVSILEFRVKELEKNSDKIDALKFDILSNKANIDLLHDRLFNLYETIVKIVGFTSFIIGLFTFFLTKKKAEKQCFKWLKNHEKEIFETIEKQANSWLTNNKNEVIQHIKDTLSIEFINSLSREDGQDLMRQVIRDEISQISSDPITSKGTVSQNNRQHLKQDSIASENLIIEDSMPSPQDDFNFVKTDKNNKEQEVIELFKKAINSHGIEKNNTYRELIDQFKKSKNDEILRQVAYAYINLANELINNSQRSEAIPLLSEAIKQFKNSDNQEIKLQLAKMEFLYNSLLQNS